MPSRWGTTAVTTTTASGMSGGRCGQENATRPPFRRRLRSTPPVSLRSVPHVPACHPSRSCPSSAGSVLPRAEPVAHLGNDTRSESRAGFQLKISFGSVKRHQTRMRHDTRAAGRPCREQRCWRLTVRDACRTRPRSAMATEVSISSTVFGGRSSNSSRRSLCTRTSRARDSFGRSQSAARLMAYSTEKDHGTRGVSRLSRQTTRPTRGISQTRQPQDWMLCSWLLRRWSESQRPRLSVT